MPCDYVGKCPFCKRHMLKYLRRGATMSAVYCEQVYPPVCYLYLNIQCMYVKWNKIEKMSTILGGCLLYYSNTDLK